MKKTFLTSLSNIIFMILLAIVVFCSCQPEVKPVEPIGKQHKGKGKLVDLYAFIGKSQGQLYKYDEYIKPMSTFYFQMDYEGNYYYRTNEAPRYNFTKNDKPLADFNSQYELYMNVKATHFTVYNELFGLAKHDSILSFFAGGEWYTLETNEGQLDTLFLPVVDQDTIYGLTHVDAQFYDVVAFPLVNNRPTKEGIIHPIKIPVNNNNKLACFFVHDSQFAVVFNHTTLYINNQLQQLPNEICEIRDMGWTDNGDEIILAITKEWQLLLFKNRQMWKDLTDKVCLNQNGTTDMFIHGNDIYVLGANTRYTANFQMAIWHNDTTKVLNNYSSNGEDCSYAELYPVISWE